MKKPLLLSLLAATCTLAQAAPQTRTWSYSYHDSGLLASESGPGGAQPIAQYAYDSAGRLVQIQNALGHQTQFSNFTAHGQPQTILDANGVATQLTYTAQGWLHTSTTAQATTSHTYDAAGNITQTTLPDGSYLQYTWDAAGRLTAMQNALGERIEYQLDARGNRTQTQILDSAGTIRFQQQQVFDELGRLLRSMGAQGQTRHYGYDLEGNPTSIQDARGHTQTRSFDALHRLSQIQDALGGTSSFVHDGQDRIVEASDPRTVSTSTTWNALGDLTEHHSPDSGNTTHTYDTAGRISQSTDADGRVTQYTWDALGRMLTRGHPADSSLNVQYGYDSTANGNHGVGRLTSVQDASGSTHYQWNALGQLAQQNHSTHIGPTSQTQTITYNYNLAGKLTSITLPHGVHIQYQQDAAGRTNQVLWKHGNQPLETVASSITRTPWGALQNLDWSNGVTLARTYDLNGRLTGQTLGGLDSSTHTLDENGNITQMASSAWGTLDYTYDALERLVQSTHAGQSTSYAYDAGGNRTAKTLAGASTTYSYAATSNRLTAIGANPVLLDASGNTIQDAQGRTYNWDAQGRLHKVHMGTSELARYTWNALGQRTHKITSSAITSYLYHPGGQLLGWTRHSLTGMAQHSQYPVWLENTPIAVIQIDHDADGDPAQTQILYLHPDHLATPRMASDAMQTVVWQLPPWQPFGEDAQHSDPDGDGIHTHIPLRFAGQLFDAETGLHHNYFRDYDPASGRYLQSDPAGLVGGFNGYVYVDNHPLGYVDPFGEFGVPGAIYGAISGAIGGYIVSGNWQGAAVGAVAGGFTGFFFPGGGIISGSLENAAANITGQAFALWATGRDHRDISQYNPGAVLGAAAGGAIGRPLNNLVARNWEVIRVSPIGRPVDAKNIYDFPGRVLGSSLEGVAAGIGELSAGGILDNCQK